LGFGRAQETERIRENLDRARPDDFLALFGEFFQDREHQVLLAQRRGAFDTKLFGHGDQFGR